MHPSGRSVCMWYLCPHRLYFPSSAFCRRMKYGSVPTTQSWKTGTSGIAEAGGGWASWAVAIIDTELQTGVHPNSEPGRLTSSGHANILLIVCGGGTSAHRC